MLAFFCFLNTSRAFGQGISISVKKQPLESVFKIIEKQSGYLFWCEKELLQKARPVDLTINNATIEQALNACLKEQDLSYAIKGKTIVIKAKDKASEKKSINSKGLVVTGQVTSENASVLPGVSIRQKGSQRTTVTDKEGKFSIEVTDFNAILQFSYVGYELKEVRASNAEAVSLAASTSKLDEVQVIAYGTTTRRLSTSSISTIKAADIENQPVSNPLAALQGRVPGLLISQTSGVAGSAFKVQLRGQTSLDPSLSQNNPLFIIDGIPFEAGNTAANQINSAANNPTSISSGGLSPLNTLNPQDIESIDVLKDADATSIYGNRGANGVILITTKKGQAGKTNVRANVYSGISRIGRSMDMLDTKEYIAVRKEAMENDGIKPGLNPAVAGYAPDLLSWDTTRYTDFKKLLIGNTGHSTNYKISVSGGNTGTQFIVGAGYNKQTSVYPGSFADNVISFNTGITHQSQNKRFNLIFSANYANDRNTLPRYDLTRYINLPPNLKLYNDDGSLSWSENGVAYATVNNHTNPLSYTLQMYDAQNENLSGSLSLSYQILEGLKLKVTSGYNRFIADEKTNKPSASIDPIFDGIVLPSAEFANQKTSSWIVEPQLEYTLPAEKSGFNILLGNTIQNKQNVGQYLTGFDYTSDILLGSIRGAGRIDASNINTLYRYTAFFGRINYNFANRYILNVSARRDGSSRFSPEQRWANFAAVGIAWIFTEENFLKNLLPLMSFGKLRGSYGTTGNDQIGDYKFLNLWTNTLNPYNNVPGLYPRSLYNPTYEWEINNKLELGLDMGFLKDRLLVTLAYYRNRSNNQLINYKLASQSGFTSVIQNSPAEVENTGFEFTMTSKNFERHDFSWSTSVNISIPRNRLISFPNLSGSSYASRYQEGRSLNLIRGYKFLYLDQQTGIYKFEDVNGDGLLNSGSDYQFLANTDPKFFGGLQNNISFKNFDLQFFFQYNRQTGASYISKLANTVPGYIYNQPSIVLERWLAPGQQSNIEKFTATPGSAAALSYSYFGNSDGAYTDASFLRLKNLSLGYQFKGNWLSKIHLSALKVYVESQNLLTITSYKGPDPETQDFYVLPPLRTVVAGIQLNL